MKFLLFLFINILVAFIFALVPFSLDPCIYWSILDSSILTIDLIRHTNFMIVHSHAITLSLLVSLRSTVSITSYNNTTISHFPKTQLWKTQIHLLHSPTVPSNLNFSNPMLVHVWFCEK
jgi:hypothetical protein